MSHVETKKNGVLIIDDSVFIRGMLKDILKRKGIPILGEASDGEAGLEKYKEILPTIVFLDINMPKKSGLEVLSSIRSSGDNNTIIVMISAQGQSEILAKSLTQGANDFIVKPFHERQVIGTLERCIAQERRQSPRVNIPGFKVDYRAGSSEKKWRPAEVANLSESGVQLIVSEILPPGSTIEVRLKTEKFSEPIMFEGKVQWTNSHINGEVHHGIQFENVDSDSQVKIKEFICEHLKQLD